MSESLPAITKLEAARQQIDFAIERDWRTYRYVPG